MKYEHSSHLVGAHHYHVIIVMVTTLAFTAMTVISMASLAKGSLSCLS
jgi:hypothetical protein